MYYVRGNPNDYNKWEKMGNSGWGWETVLKYFKKSEDNTNPKYAADIRNHATGGPIKVGRLGADDPIKTLVKKGLKELGFKEIRKSNGNEFLGYYEAQGTLYNGERFEAAKGYLATAKGRPNLHVIKNALVTELTFNENNTATGIKFVLDNVNLIASAKKEVVLSAGTINSPQILKLSGIGPRDELEKLNILVRKDLPVGFNLQDHLLVPLVAIFDNGTSTPMTLTDLADAMYQYTVHREGYLSNIGSGDLLTFFSTTNDHKYPDIESYILSFDEQDSGLPLVLNSFNLNPDLQASFLNANQFAKLNIFGVSLLHPKSRGNVELASASPFDAPKIHANYFDEQEDVETVIKAIKKIMEITKTKSFADHNGQVVKMNLPPCDKFEYESDSYWECYARQITVTIYHPAGTCKMGPIEEAATVVDPDLKVKGIEGLRVVDASIMPTIISGNLNAPTVMIAEYASDKIKKDWQ